jgi:hypothetical protein
MEVCYLIVIIGPPTLKAQPEVEGVRATNTGDT